MRSNIFNYIQDHANAVYGGRECAETCLTSLSSGQLWDQLIIIARNISRRLGAAKLELTDAVSNIELALPWWSSVLHFLFDFARRPFHSCVMWAMEWLQPCSTQCSWDTILQRQRETLHLQGSHGKYVN